MLNESRVVAAVVVACLGAPAPAMARDLTTLRFRADLATDTARAITAPLLTPAALTTPRIATPLGTSYDKGRVAVRTSAGANVVTLAVGKLDYEWMPWSILQPGILVFDWRERIVPRGNPESTRDVLRGIDLASGTERWRRNTAGAIASAVGDHLFLLNTGTGTGFDLVDSRSGKTVRRVALAGNGPNTLAIAGGDTLIDTGAVLARADGQGVVGWQVPTRGAVGVIVPLASPATRYGPDARAPTAPLPTTSDWLVLAGAELLRIDPATGTIRWSVAATSTSLLVDGTEVCVADVARDPVTAIGTVTLVVRDLATGAAMHRVPLVRRTELFDSATAVVVARRGTDVEVTAEFFVLD